MFSIFNSLYQNDEEMELLEIVNIGNHWINCYNSSCVKRRFKIDLQIDF